MMWPNERRYCAVVIYYLEMAFVDESLYVNQFATFGDAVWWAVATITSVGCVCASGCVSE